MAQSDNLEKGSCILVRNIETPLFSFQGVRCEKCGRIFSELSNLYRHDRNIHLRERNHRCHVCGSAFGRSDTLKSHMLLHFPNGEQQILVNVDDIVQKDT